MTGPERDFYEVLGVPRSADDEAIRRAFRRLAREFHPRGPGNGRVGEGSPVGPARVLAEVELEAFEATWGTRRPVRIRREELCAVCAGSGYAPGHEVRVCGTCVGRGTLRASSGLGTGRWLQVEPCGSCGGDGWVRLPCSGCDGAGKTMRERTITVRIAPGVEDGARLRVVGEPEDSHLVVRVLPRPPESRLVRFAAAALFALALAFLVFLLQTA